MSIFFYFLILESPCELLNLGELHVPSSIYIVLFSRELTYDLIDYEAYYIVYS